MQCKNISYKIIIKKKKLLQIVSKFSKKSEVEILEVYRSDHGVPNEVKKVN